MRALVLVAHPDPHSFSHAAAQAAVDGLQAGGHEVTVLDLYANGFDAAMSPAERRAYPSGRPLIDPQTQASADLVRAAHILVFCYPTWWSSMPAVLKGWLDRTMVEGVAFRFNERRKIRPGLGHVRRIVGISTYGSPKSYVKAINDNGRRTLMRTLRMNAGWRTRRTWLALYAMDRIGPVERSAFLARVRDQASTW
ncbi:MAG TPA: NAD(P)H-dependent oxidoreductase [Ilumatobacteraceae bacterium]|nr:NAD(P)H-dependent oxidoreductase [Ilumatobacteraceae bacterium]